MSEGKQVEYQQQKRSSTTDRVLLMVTIVLQAITMIMLWMQLSPSATPDRRQPQAAAAPALHAPPRTAPDQEIACTRSSDAASTEKDSPAAVTAAANDTEQAAHAGWVSRSEYIGPDDSARAQWGVQHAAAMHRQAASMLAEANSRFEEMERLFAGASAPAEPSAPTMDMRESGNLYVVSFSIPGIDPDQIRVALDGRILTVRLLPSSPNSTHQFEQRILIPSPVADNEPPRAMVTNGILRISVPLSHGDDGSRRTS